MGYTSWFNGTIQVQPPLNEHEISFLRDFNQTRRMNRTKGPLYVGSTENLGQNHDLDVTDYNRPHPDQPGLWCHWAPSDDGTAIEWDGGEKFYDSLEWMEYIVNGLLSRSGYVKAHLNEDERLKHFTCNHVCNGEIYVEGEESDDRWKITVKDNRVQGVDGAITYSDEEPALTETELQEALRSIRGTSTVTAWTALVTLYGNPHVTVHASEEEAWESLRVNYADEIAPDDHEALKDALDREGIGYEVDSHEVEVPV